MNYNEMTPITLFDIYDLAFTTLGHKLELSFDQFSWLKFPFLFCAYVLNLAPTT